MQKRLNKNERKAIKQRRKQRQQRRDDTIMSCRGNWVN